MSRLLFPSTLPQPSPFHCIALHQRFSTYDCCLWQILSWMKRASFEWDGQDNSHYFCTCFYLCLSHELASPFQRHYRLVQKQCAFLWTGENKCRGSQCKAAWDDVSLPKNKGGLGVLDLAKKNKSFLKKSLVRFHYARSALWIDWLRNAYGWNEYFDFGDNTSNITSIWKDIYV